MTACMRIRSFNINKVLVLNILSMLFGALFMVYVIYSAVHVTEFVKHLGGIIYLLQGYALLFYGITGFHKKAKITIRLSLLLWVWIVVLTWLVSFLMPLCYDSKKLETACYGAWGVLFIALYFS